MAAVDNFRPARNLKIGDPPIRLECSMSASAIMQQPKIMHLMASGDSWGNVDVPGAVVQRFGSSCSSLAEAEIGLGVQFILGELS